MAAGGPVSGTSVEFVDSRNAVRQDDPWLLGGCENVDIWRRDESEALTHPYLARAWAKRGADLRVPAPGQSKKVAMTGHT
jgi:hypothetical protein